MGVGVGVGEAEEVGKGWGSETTFLISKFLWHSEIPVDK